MQAKIYSGTFLGPSELLGVYKQRLSFLPIDASKKITRWMEGTEVYFGGCI